MREPKTEVGKDNRPIECIAGPGEEGVYRKVGWDGVTAIKVYEEMGPMDRYPWFAVYSGDEISARVNSVHVEIVRYFQGDQS